MALLDNAVTASAGEVARHRQESWPAQAAHVARSSDFYRDLWAGKAPPKGKAGRSEPVGGKEGASPAVPEAASPARPQVAEPDELASPGGSGHLIRDDDVGATD